MTTDRMGRDELTNAVIERDFNKAAQLLAKGCDPNSTDKAGWSPLHFAAQNDDARMVRTLLSYGASTALKDEWGNTALSRAVFNHKGGSGECIVALLDAGADPDAKNNNGMSPRGLAESIANYDTRKFFAD